MSHPVIELSDVTVSLGGARIIEDLTITVHERERLVITGPSGAGKTTVFGLVLGFVSPEMGQVRFNGAPVTPATVGAVRRSVAYVAQSSSVTDETAMEYYRELLSFRANHHLSLETSRLDEYLEVVGLSRRLLDTPFGDLSGGEQRRAALVGGLLLERPILLLDEVTAGVDEARTERIVDHVLTAIDATIVVISHEAAWHRADKATIFALGGTA